MHEPASDAGLLVQVVPPTSGGVRDFAECLKRQWALAGRPSQLFECDQAWARREPLAQRLRSAFDSPAQDCALLLHFSGYGYDPRGLCLWLLGELRQARRQLGARLRVVTMFHELYADGPPWRSAFWLGAVQAGIARRVAQSSDAVWTNSTHHAAWLHKALDAPVPMQVLPVFSTIGEPASVPPYCDRLRGLVVFGSQSTRQRALDRLDGHQSQLRALGIEHVLEAGAGRRSRFAGNGLTQIFLGRLDEARLRGLMQANRFGLIDYPSIHLSKSTVFAAYAVNGCVVLNTAPPGADTDGLHLDRHYLSLAKDTIRAMSPDAVAEIASHARDWYGQHPLRLQAASFLELLQTRSDAAMTWPLGQAPAAAKAAHG